MIYMNILKIILSKKGNVLLVFIISLLIWSPLFSLYWAQDDFWIISNARNFTIHKLVAGTNEGFLRPVSTFWYPFALQSIFGENPFVYHLINGLISASTAVVVYFIAYQLTKNKHLSLIAGIVYGTHLAHMFEQSWFSG